MRILFMRAFTMAASKPRRYFINHCHDYTEGEVTIPKSEIQNTTLRHIQNIVGRLAPSHTEDGGIYIGGIGVAYMFYRVAMSEDFGKNSSEYLNYSLQYLKPVLTSSTPESPGDDPTSLLLGDVGLYAVASAVYKRLGDEGNSARFARAYESLHSNYLPMDFLKFGGDELFVGRAGYLAGALWLERELQSQVLSDAVKHQICKSIMKSGRHYSKLHKNTCPLMFSYYGTEYVGAAHGLSFILQMLLSVPGFLDSDASIKRDITTAIDYVLSLQTESGNFPCALDEVGEHARSESDELVHWCHGAPGVVYLMAKAYLVFNNDKYLNSCVKAGELVWRKGLLKKGPGICHGVSGNGYVFLLLYRLTADKKHLHRAIEFANFMESQEFEDYARTPDSPYSLFEGLSGTVCYLVDILEPDEAYFPFQNVFD